MALLASQPEIIHKKSEFHKKEQASHKGMNPLSSAKRFAFALLCKAGDSKPQHIVTPILRQATKKKEIRKSLIQFCFLDVSSQNGRKGGGVLW